MCLGSVNPYRSLAELKARLQLDPPPASSPAHIHHLVPPLICSFTPSVRIGRSPNYIGLSTQLILFIDFAQDNQFVFCSLSLFILSFAFFLSFLFNFPFPPNSLTYHLLAHSIGSIHFSKRQAMAFKTVYLFHVQIMQLDVSAQYIQSITYRLWLVVMLLLLLCRNGTDGGM